MLLAAHLAHSGVLWTEEDLPLAAGLRMLHGSVLYREVWFDKPPLVPALYMLWGARIGPVLRVAGAVYALVCCALAYALAAGIWSRREGYWAAGLTGFFLTFDTQSAVLPLAADLLLLAPHLAAVLLAWRRRAFLAGVAAGVGFLVNAKGVFVLAACALFVWPGVVPLLAGFAAPNVAALLWLLKTGAFGAYLDQVWRWPARYAGSPVVSDPVWNGVVRTANWLGFHAVLAVGAGAFWWMASRRLKSEPGEKMQAVRFAAWAGLCLAGVVLGWRFFPRYYFLLLPALTIPAARGLSAMRSRAALALAVATMIVPLARFGPRYVRLAGWNDLALDRDSQAASRLALRYAPAGGSLYVWGYRPEDYVYTGLRPATRFLECQALTGVPADRHLTQSAVVLTAGTREAREELARSRPDVVIDGLSPYNPALAMDRYPELRAWLQGYEVAGRTQGSVVYVRRNTLASSDAAVKPSTIGR